MATHSSIQAGEFCGLYSLCGHKESDTTELLSLLTKLINQVKAEVQLVCSLRVSFPKGTQGA